MTGGASRPRARLSPLPMLKKLTEQAMTVADLVNEPLWSIKPDLLAADATAVLAAREFDLAGMADDRVASYVTRHDLEASAPGALVRDVAKPVLASDVVEKTLPLVELVRILGDREWAFVIDGDHVGWIATRADLQSPAVGVVVLAYLIAVETGLSILVPQELGNHWYRHLRRNRIAEVLEIYERKRKQNVGIGLEECLFFTDWLTLAARSPDLVKRLGFASKSQFGRTRGPIIDLRNDLAHGGTVLDHHTPSSAVGHVERIRGLARRVWDLVEEQPSWWEIYAQTVITSSSGVVLAGPNAVSAVPHDLPAHIITGWNPGSLTQTDEVNEAANRRLKERLLHLGCSPFVVTGASPDADWTETSFLVNGLDRTAAASIGAEFGQQAVFELTHDELLVIKSPPEGDGVVGRHPRQSR